MIILFHTVFIFLIVAIAQDSIGQFEYPPPGLGSPQENVIWTSGDMATIKWTTTMTDFEIVLNQIDIGLGITKLALVVFDTKKNALPKPPSYDWQVQHPNYDLNQSPVFTFQLRPPQKMEVDLNNPDPFVNSHFFNISASHPPLIIPPKTTQPLPLTPTESLPALPIAAIATPEVTVTVPSSTLASTQFSSSASSVSALSSTSPSFIFSITTISSSHLSLAFLMPVSTPQPSIITESSVTTSTMNASTISYSSTLTRAITNPSEDVPKWRTIISSSSSSGVLSWKDVLSTSITYSTISAPNTLSPTFTSTAKAQQGKSLDSSKGRIAGIVLGTIVGASVIFAISTYAYWKKWHERQEGGVRIEHEEVYSDLKPLHRISLPIHPVEPFELDSATSPTELPDERWEQRPVELC